MSIKRISTSRSYTPVTRLILVTIADNVAGFVPPKKAAYSPVHANAIR